MALMIMQSGASCHASVIACPNEAPARYDPGCVVEALRCTECVGAHDAPRCRQVCERRCTVPAPSFEESRAEVEAECGSLHS